MILLSTYFLKPISRDKYSSYMPILEDICPEIYLSYSLLMPALWPRKKYKQNSGFRSGISPDPHRPFGDFENPLRAQGIWAKIPSQKPEFSIWILVRNFT